MASDQNAAPRSGATRFCNAEWFLALFLPLSLGLTGCPARNTPEVAVVKSGSNAPSDPNADRLAGTSQGDEAKKGDLKKVAEKTPAAKEDGGTKDHVSNVKKDKPAAKDNGEKKEVPAKPVEIKWATEPKGSVPVTNPPDLLCKGADSFGEVEAVIKAQIVRKGMKEEIVMDSTTKFKVDSNGRVSLKAHYPDGVWGALARVVQKLGDPNSESVIRIALYKVGFTSTGVGNVRPEDTRLSNWLELTVSRQ